MRLHRQSLEMPSVLERDCERLAIQTHWRNSGGDGDAGWAGSVDGEQPAFFLPMP
jgi:hypothetical protein